MAMVPRSAMRIIALPLMRPSVNANASSFGKLPTFYSYKIIAPPPIRKASAPRTFFTRWMPEEGLGRWASHKASRTWANFGMAGEGTLKLRAFQMGERFMDRLDFEESNLKILDLSIAPPLKVDGKIVEAGRDTRVPLLYPPAVFSGPQSLDHLRALVAERIPLHNRGAMMWIFFAVLSAPLKFIPIIPNFPFYFCAWRSWSHLKGKSPRPVISARLTLPNSHARCALRPESSPEQQDRTRAARGAGRGVPRQRVGGRVRRSDACGSGGRYARAGYGTRRSQGTAPYTRAGPVACREGEIIVIFYNHLSNP
ncbi:mitochondrial K+-H+ exchange-related-domain-containing protein [Mycena epipterygia]|nr:mitochondrial K+-H+ exchange-related-domain-containing protein [Mycena epipterygia]